MVYTRAGEPLLEPSLNQTDREPDLPSSSCDEKTDWDRLLQAIHTIPKFKTSTRRGQKWEQMATESGVASDILAQAIERYGDELAVGCDSPVWLIQKAAELIESGRSGIKIPTRWTLDGVRGSLTCALNFDDDGVERLECMAKCGDQEIERAAIRALERVRGVETARRSAALDDSPAKDASEVGSPLRGFHSGQRATSQHGILAATAERSTDEAQRAYQRLADASWSDRYGEFDGQAVAA